MKAYLSKEEQLLLLNLMQVEIDIPENKFPSRLSYVDYQSRLKRLKKKLEAI